MNLRGATRLFAAGLLLAVAHGYVFTQTDITSTKSGGASVSETGILLVDDFRCEERSQDLPKTDLCPEGAHQWGLSTLTRQYYVRGNKSELKQYERRGVTVAGTISKDADGTEIFDVQSITASEMTESEIQDLIEQMRHDEWTEPQNIANPTLWIFNFTPPMWRILHAGLAAQDILLKYLDDRQIRDHIIILLGGVGNEKAVLPIINAMADRDQTRNDAYARKINRVANLALTNITVAAVIWHHGGGITRDACPDDPKSCWYAWWLEQRETFTVSKTPSRNYSNYPGYGIYQRPSSRIESTR